MIDQSTPIRVGVEEVGNGPSAREAKGDERSPAKARVSLHHPAQRAGMLYQGWTERRAPLPIVGYSVDRAALSSSTS